MGFRNSLSASGYAVLNAIRALNIVAFLLVMAAAIVMVVKTIMVSSFYIFDGITHIIIFFVAAALLITEIGIFPAYIARNWPLFGNEHGFATLALFMITMSVSVLGNLNKGATSPTSIGSGFYELVMAAGILTFIMGWANLVANYMFRQVKVGVTARMVRAHGKQARRFAEDTAPVAPYTPSPPMQQQARMMPQTPPQPVNKYAASSFYTKSRAGSVRSSRSGYTEHTVLPSRSASYNISRPMPADPLAVHPPVQVPDAIHPAFRNGNGNAF